MVAEPCVISANFELLVMVVYLSKFGLDYYEDVVKIIFQYAEMLRRVGPQESIFKEVMIHNLLIIFKIIELCIIKLIFISFSR